MKTALIIIDIQNDYFEGGKAQLTSPEVACKNAGLVLDYFRNNNLPVVHIQHIATRPNATFFIPGTEGVEINRNVKPAANETVIVKHFPNGFRETNLLEYLTENKITDLVICGMQTHMCVDSTTRAAKDLGFNCTVIGDACATKDLEINGVTVNAADVQTAFLSALNYFYASVLTSEQYLNKERAGI